MDTVGIIILNWNTPDLTINTINSILKISHSGFKFHLILVDNGSKTIYLKQLEKLYAENPKVTILKLKTNTGYTHGNNVGISYALKEKYEYIMIANSDIRVDPFFLQNLYQQIIKNHKLILAPKIYFEKGYEFHRDRYQPSDLGKVIWALGGQIDWNNIYGSNIAIDQIDNGQYDKNLAVPDFISGCCFLVHSQFFVNNGMFDEKYYLYLEDTELSVRAVRNGYQLKIIPESKIWHINSGSAAPSSNIQDYFITRNRLLFAMQYAPLRTKLAIIRESFRLIISGRPWQKRGVLDYYFSQFGKGSWQ